MRSHKDIVYLNNAATTYPKPQCVLDAHAAALCAVPASQYRSAADCTGKDVFEKCRTSIGRLLHIADTERIWFSSGATDSANKLIWGLTFSGKKIITTQTEHNSILRPLFNHPVYKKQLVILPCDGHGKVDITPILHLKKGEASALFINHCSNVTGMIQDMEAVCRAAKEKQLTVFADISQSAGCIPVDVDGWGLDGVIFTGHKGLLGAQGTGGCYVRREIDLKPVFYGGTGRDSSRLTYEDGDYEYEVGTQNAPGVAALLAGTEYVLGFGVEEITRKENALLERLYHGFEEIEGVRIIGAPKGSRGPLLSITVDGLLPSDIAYILQNGYGIVVRAGLHCAPLIHRATGTQRDGTVRISTGLFTEEEDIDRVLEAVAEISESVRKG